MHRPPCDQLTRHVSTQPNFSVILRYPSGGASSLSTSVFAVHCASIGSRYINYGELTASRNVFAAAGALGLGWLTPRGPGGQWNAW